jgi:hypothetical protein
MGQLISGVDICGLISDATSKADWKGLWRKVMTYFKALYQHPLRDCFLNHLEHFS